MFGGQSGAVPSALNIGLIGPAKPGGHLNAPVNQFAPLSIANRIQRRNLAFGEFGEMSKDFSSLVRIPIGQTIGLRDMGQRPQDIIERGRKWDHGGPPSLCYT